MAASINRVVLVGNLTRDPELRHTPSGMPVCSLRLAVNARRKDETRPVGRQAQLLRRSPSGASRARTARSTSPRAVPVAVDGRLEWREWEAQDGTEARRPSRSSPTASSSSAAAATARAAASTSPAGAAAARADADFAPSAADDDIPF